MTETILRSVKDGERFGVILWTEDQVCLGSKKTGVLRWSKLDDMTQEYTTDK